MTFNWFNRPNQSDQAPTNPDQSSIPEKPATSTATPESEAAADELLDYAKRAYQNLQKQRAEDGDGDGQSADELVSQSGPQSSDAIAEESTADAPVPQPIAETQAADATPETPPKTYATSRRFGIAILGPGRERS